MLADIWDCWHFSFVDSSHHAYLKTNGNSSYPGVCQPLFLGFWLVIATTLGVLPLSHRLKTGGIGCLKMGICFIYILVTTIGMQMNLREVFQHLGLLPLASSG